MADKEQRAVTTEGAKPAPSHPLDLKLPQTRKSKKPYIFDFAASRSCTHPVLTEMVQGTGTYRCHACNYAFRIDGAHQMPLHWTPIEGIQQLRYFVREFGVEALEEVVRKPLGSYDHSQQKPILPPGKSLMDVLQEDDNHDGWLINHRLEQILLGRNGDDDGRKGLSAPDGDGDVPALPEG